MNVTIFIAVLAVFIVAISIAIFIIKVKRFKPSNDKKAQLQQINRDLEPTGFAYDPSGDYFYSLMNCWQREMGYCRLYDEAAPFFNMIMDCEPITFSYGGKRWLIELWKGQYGITSGAEIGIYNTAKDDILHEKFTGTFYEPISEKERLPMSFVLKRHGRTILERRNVHWWLTGFILGKFSSQKSLTMIVMIDFPNIEMRDAFVHSLRELGYRRREFRIMGTMVEIKYTKPHSTQHSNKLQKGLVQSVNKNNCRIYRQATKKYPDTLDKLEYIKAVMPELYEIFIHSIYAKGLYDAFGWIKQPVSPVPPTPPCPPPTPPCPPTPCPDDPCQPCCPPPPCCEDEEEQDNCRD